MKRSKELMKLRRLRKIMLQGAKEKSPILEKQGQKLSIRT